MRVCVLRHVLGEPLDILFDVERRSYRPCDGPPADTWVIGDRDADRSLDALAHLSDMPIRTSPPEPFVRAMRQLTTRTVRWRHVLPKRVFDATFSTMLDDSVGLLERGCVSYYDRTFRATRACLRSLERARVDPAVLDRHIAAEPNPTNRSALETLRPDAQGFAQLVAYDQLATVTGRLTVTSGPRILTLPKRYRDVIASRYDGGSIVSLDYSSVEPRVALLAVGKQPSDDIYAHISDVVMGGMLTRTAVKIVTLALLYGAGEKKIEEMSGLRNGDLRNAIDSISAYFEIESLRRSLEEQMDATGTILNAYGRPIRVCDRRKLINYFNQSTASELALLGFGAAIDRIRTEGWSMHPIFLIHDAMLLDVHPDHRKYIEAIRSTSEWVPGYGSRFPVKVEELGHVRG